MLLDVEFPTLACLFFGGLQIMNSSGKNEHSVMGPSGLSSGFVTALKGFLHSSSFSV